jgi:hypothetical protein
VTLYSLFCGGDTRFREHSAEGEAIPVQAWTGPEGCRRLRPPGFKTVGTYRW